MVAGESNVLERKSSQRWPRKTLIKHPRLLSIEGVVNHSEIQHYALSFPTQKGSKGSVELNSHFILWVDDLLKPHAGAAEYEKWQNEEDSKHHSNTKAAIAALARSGACDWDVGLGDHLRLHIHWHHGIHRHLAYLHWVDLRVGHLDRHLIPHWHHSAHRHHRHRWNHWSTNDLSLVEASDDVELAAPKRINSFSQS